MSNSCPLEADGGNFTPETIPEQCNQCIALAQEWENLLLVESQDLLEESAEKGKLLESDEMVTAEIESISRPDQSSRRLLATEYFIVPLDEVEEAYATERSVQEFNCRY